MVELKTDDDILNALRNNRSAAFNHIYTNIYPVISAYIKRNSGTEEKAKDVFQEAMIIFYEKVMNMDFKLTASIQTFLFAVCKNLWLKDLRDNRKEIPVDLQEQKGFDGPRDEDPFFQNDRMSTLTKSVQEYLIKLGNPCRKILIYYYYFKYSMDTISDKLGYASSNSVKSQKYKCIERLKKTVPNRIKTLLYTS
jgi:RNA polymerase sigma factor (sigma-70 family)